MRRDGVGKEEAEIRAAAAICGIFHALREGAAFAGGLQRGWMLGYENAIIHGRRPINP